MTGITLSKHHGLGNDFLVAFHPPLPEAELSKLAEAVCARHTGIGADGLLVGESDPEHTARMVLYNADGSRAEMSGNGIRCFAQALAARRGDLSPQRIATDAGPRRVELSPSEEGPDAARIEAAVDMGEIAEIEEPADWHRIGT